MTLVARIHDLAAQMRDKINQMMPRLLPPGGATGQVLTKASASDYSLQWSTASSGGSGIASVSADPNPTLGGTLSTNNNQIVATIASSGSTQWIKTVPTSSSVLSSNLSIAARNVGDTATLAGLRINQLGNTGTIYYAAGTHSFQDGYGNPIFTMPTTVGTSGQFLTSRGNANSSLIWTTPPSSGLTATSVIHVRDEKPNGTPGGTSATGTQTRVLNTVKTNTISGASLANNIVTLPAGTYYVDASCQHYNDSGSRNKMWIKNETTGETLVSGWNIPSTPMAIMACRGFFTLTTTTNVSVQMYAAAGYATNGLGAAGASGQVEVYAEAIFWKNV